MSATRRPQHPRWIDHCPTANLREVAPSLYVGAQYSPQHPTTWELVVDFYGQRHPRGSVRAKKLIQIPFNDGSSFPTGALDKTYLAVREALKSGPVLIHCRAGLSRSVSAAYAMLRALYGLSHLVALHLVRGNTPGFPVPATLMSARQWVHTSPRQRLDHR